MLRKRKKSSLDLNKKVNIALGKTAFSNAIVQKELTVKTLFNRLQTPEIRAKKDGKYFIFADFKEDKRNALNVKHYYGATIDIDNAKISLKKIRHKLMKYTYCLYTTFSHKMKGKGNRYRIVIPYKLHVTPEEHVDLVLYFMDLLGIGEGVDLSSKTLSLPMYLPAVNKHNSDHFNCIINNGIYFNPNSEHIRDAIPQLRLKYYNSESTYNPVDINKDIEEGERNAELTRVVGSFIAKGSSKESALELAQTFNETKIHPPLDEDEVEQIVNSVIKAHSRNHNDLLWGFDEIMSRMQSSENAVQEFEHLCKMIAYGRLHNKFSVPQQEMLVNELREKTNLKKTTVNQQVSKASLEIQGEDEKVLEEAIVDQSESIKERFANWVYVATDDRLYNVVTGELYKRESFNAMFQTADLNSPMFNILIKYNLINKVSRFEFDPTKKSIYTRNRLKYVNTYIPPDIEPEEGDVTPLLKHFEYLFPSDKDRNIVLDFIAHLVQKPGKKIRWMLVIKGSKGIGKTLIAEKVILNVIGFSNIGKVENQLVKSDFNAWQLNKQLVVFEELNLGDSAREKKQMTEKLKSFITDNIMKAHRKGLDPYDVVNKSCSIGFTNEELPIVITTDERRFCMVRTDAKPKTDKYYEKFVKYVDKNTPKIYNYFMERDIKKFPYQVAPTTDYTLEVKQLSLGWPMNILWELAQGKYSKYVRHYCITYGDIVRIIKARSTERHKMLAEDLNSVGSTLAKSLICQMRDFGFRKLEKPGKRDQRFFIKGKKQTIWILPDKKNEIAKIPTALIRKELNSFEVPQEETSDDLPELDEE